MQEPLPAKGSSQASPDGSSCSLGHGRLHRQERVTATSAGYAGLLHPSLAM